MSADSGALPAHRPDRAVLFLQDVLATPDILERLVDAYTAPSGPLATSLAELDRRVAALTSPLRRIVMTGMGSSRFAALAAVPTKAMEITGTHSASIHVEVASARTIEPSDGTLLVGISNSGRTDEVVAAIREHRGSSLTVGVTNHTERSVGAEAEIALPLLAGAEASGIASTTYAATIAVLAMLLARVVDRGSLANTFELLHQSVSAARTLRADRAPWLGPVADLLDGADEIHVVGSGRAIGTLEQTALMFREAPRLRALPMDAGDWLHVGLYTMLPGGCIVLFGGTAYDAEIVQTAAARGARLVAAGPELPGADAWIPLPLVEEGAPTAIRDAAVAELVAAALWGRL